MPRRRHKAPSFDPDARDTKRALPYAAAFAAFVVLGVVLIVRGLIK